MNIIHSPLFTSMETSDLTPPFIEFLKNRIFYLPAQVAARIKDWSSVLELLSILSHSLDACLPPEVVNQVVDSFATLTVLGRRLTHPCFSAVEFWAPIFEAELTPPIIDSVSGIFQVNFLLNDLTNFLAPLIAQLPSNGYTIVVRIASIVPGLVNKLVEKPAFLERVREQHLVLPRFLWISPCNIQFQPETPMPILLAVASFMSSDGTKLMHSESMALEGEDLVRLQDFIHTNQTRFQPRSRR
jgi:hypothetical protein